jgi:hypothetical protein
MAEARELARKRLGEMATMPFDELLQLIDHPVDSEAIGPSGKRYRSKTFAFWDMEPHESDLYARVQVRGQGLRRYQRYYGVETRSPENEFRPYEEDRDGVSSSWTENFAWAAFGLLLLALAVPWFVGVGYLISKII